jgi:hypothetical protein
MGDDGVNDRRHFCQVRNAGGSIWEGNAGMVYRVSLDV